MQMQYFLWDRNYISKYDLDELGARCITPFTSIAYEMYAY
jgi:hypothetical protein